MKNTEIKPGQVVPAEIRLHVYTEALAIMNNAISGNSQKYCALGNGLCLVLPCILWGLKTFMQNAPFNEVWWPSQAEEMFPELTQSRINFIDCDLERRVQMLQEMIDEVSEILTPKTINK